MMEYFSILNVWVLFLVVIYLTFINGIEISGNRTLADLDEISRNISAILRNLVQADVYDRRLRPDYGGEPVTVGVTMYISSLSAISEVTMDYTLDFYLRQSWFDRRLAFNSMVDELTIDVEYLKRIWIPDTFFPNEKHSYFHVTTTHNSFLRINSSGNVLTSQRITVTAACAMSLHYFPLDSQECSLELESYGYSTKDVRYHWLEEDRDPVSLSPHVTLPQFMIVDRRYTELEAVLSTGTYSRMSCTFVFQRRLGFYLLTIYLPSVLIVIVSWISFWLNRSASPARVALGVTTVLTMTTLMSNTNSALPKVSYVKSIDIYLGICFLMVFSTLIEYAAVGYLSKKQHLLDSPSSQRLSRGSMVSFAPLLQLPSSVRIQDTHANGERPESLFHETTATKRSILSNTRMTVATEAEFDDSENDSARKAKKSAGSRRNTVVIANGEMEFLERKPRIAPSDIDKYSRICYPIVFALFNVVYWISYLHISGHSLHA